MATQAQAAVHVGVDRRSFQHMLDQGIVTRRVNYDLGEVAREVIAHYRDKDRKELEQQKARAAKSQADRTELDIAQKLRHLLPADAFVKAWAGLAAVFNTKCHALPKAKASLFVGLKTNAQAEERLRKIVVELLEGILGTDPKSIIKSL